VKFISGVINSEIKLMHDNLLPRSGKTFLAQREKKSSLKD